MGGKLGGFHGASLELLNGAMAYIRSVPYKVSARWLFYRLLQDGTFNSKKDYRGKFMHTLARARKLFYDGWAPDILADDTREIVPGGEGYWDRHSWLRAVREGLKYEKDKWLNQEYYIELWFEAKAMRGQFEYYTEEIPLLPFGGDISIPAKWETAKRLERAAADYELPIVIGYFGDDDPKGQEIPYSALNDIRDWCKTPFDFIRVGLNPGDADRLGIPENPEKPGTYQWEALSDEQAAALITSFIDKYYDAAALNAVRDEENEVTEQFQSYFDELIEKWGHG